MAGESGAAADLPVKRPREDGESEDNGVVSVSVEMEDTDSNHNESENMSSVIPGWFSEISPMWPGEFPLICEYISRLD